MCGFLFFAIFIRSAGTAGMVFRLAFGQSLGIFFEEGIEEDAEAGTGADFFREVVGKTLFVAFFCSLEKLFVCLVGCRSLRVVVAFPILPDVFAGIKALQEATT